MVVEMFKIIGLRDELFDAIQAKIAIRVHEKRALE